MPPVVDNGNHRLQVFNANGDFLATWGSFGDGDGQFRGPHDIAVDALGNVYVTDSGNNSVQLFGPVGEYLAT